MSTSFRIKSTVDGRADHSATTALVNNWTVQHGGADLQRTRQQQVMVRENSKIPNHGTTLVDCTRGNVELWLGNAAMEGHTKQIALTSSSRSSMHKILLHTYRGSCYISNTITLIFSQDAWDSIDGTDLAWFTTRQIDGKLHGSGVVSPYEPVADPLQRQLNELLKKTNHMPPKRSIGQGSAVDVSADGNTVVVAGCNDDYWSGAIGAVWVWVRVPAALNPTIVQALKRGSAPAATAMEARAFNRLYQSMQLAPSQEDLDQARHNSLESSSDKHLPLQGAQWLQVAKLVGSHVIDYNSSQGFSVSLAGDGHSIIVGGPSQNRGAGGVWWFSANQQDGWSEIGRYVNGEVNLDSPPPTSADMLGCSVSMQPHGPHSLAGGRGLVSCFELSRHILTVRLPEWAGKALAVDTNNLHAFVGCAALGKVWVFEWHELLNAPTNGTTPAVLQVIDAPRSNTNSNTGEDTGFGSSLASTWLPQKLVVGAHLWNYMAGAVMVYEWHKNERRYIQIQVLSDTEAPAGAIQGQGSSVAIAGQNGLSVVVGHMLSGDQTGGALQYMWDEVSNKFVMVPKSLLPRNVAQGALAGCAVACSARGDTVVVGCAGDGDHGSAAVFQ